MSLYLVCYRKRIPGEPSTDVTNTRDLESQQQQKRKGGDDDNAALVNKRNACWERILPHDCPKNVITVLALYLSGHYAHCELVFVNESCKALFVNEKKVFPVFKLKEFRANDRDISFDWYRLEQISYPQQCVIKIYVEKIVRERRYRFDYTRYVGCVLPEEFSKHFNWIHDSLFGKESRLQVVTAGDEMTGAPGGPPVEPPIYVNCAELCARVLSHAGGEPYKHISNVTSISNLVAELSKLNLIRKVPQPFHPKIKYTVKDGAGIKRSFTGGAGGGEDYYYDFDEDYILLSYSDNHN
jgi:hypothetical protein